MEQAESQANTSSQEAVEYLNTKIDNWDFENYPTPASCWLGLNISLWAAENFGQGSNEHGYTIYAPHSVDEIPGEQVPAYLQPLLTHIWKDEIFLADVRLLNLETHYDYLVTPPYIPDWESISAGGSFYDWVERIKARSDIIEGIKHGSVEFVPQTKLIFKPDYEWGLELTINPSHAKVIPFGRESKTELAYHFAAENFDKVGQIAKTIAELSVLACKYSPGYKNRTFTKETMNTLDTRFMEEQKLPFIIGRKFTPNQGLKELIVEQLTTEGIILPPSKIE